MISTLGLPYKRVDFKKSNPLVYCQKKFPANQIHIEVPGKLLPSYLLSLVHLIVSLSPILYAYLPAYAVIQSFFLTVDGRPCQKQMRFHFTKVEKTGSSTLASIFYRFVLTHQTQNVMVMTYGGHLDVTKRRAQVPGWDIGPYSSQTGKADVLIDHARFDEKFVSAHFHSDAPLIVSVREPVTWFQSAVRFGHKHLKGGKYLKAEKILNPHQVLSVNKSYTPRSVLHDEYNGQKTILHLSQLQWLGFDYAQRANTGAIKRYINYITNKFDHIFLTDQFDASLIRMRRVFCWDHSDILYKSGEVYGAGTTYISPEDRAHILSPELNQAELWLYEAFKSKVRSKYPDNNDIAQEVKHFQNINKAHKEICKKILNAIDDTVTHVIPKSKWSSAIVLDKSLCNMIQKGKYAQMTEVSKYALGIKYYLNMIYKLVDANWWVPVY